METIIGDYIGTTIGIHPPFLTKHQGVYSIMKRDAVEARKRHRDVGTVPLRIP